MQAHMWNTIDSLTKIDQHDKIEFTGRIIKIRKCKDKIFYIVSDRGITSDTIQYVNECVVTEPSAGNIINNSIVKIRGLIIRYETDHIKSCSIKRAEIQIESLEIINKSHNKLPIQISDKIILRNEGTDDKKIKVNLDTRLDNRVIDLRRDENKLIFNIKAHISKFARTFFEENDFIEIHTPKIISTASESGASVFGLKYFNKSAYLAQSPQLCTQML